MKNAEIANCPVCMTQIEEGDSKTVCPACKVVFHEECWKEIKGCSTYGCKFVNVMNPPMQVNISHGTPSRKKNRYQKLLQPSERLNENKNFSIGKTFDVIKECTRQFVDKIVEKRFYATVACSIFLSCVLGYLVWTSAVNSGASPERVATSFNRTASTPTPTTPQTILDFIQPGKYYVADWSIDNSVRRLGLLIETIDTTHLSGNGIFRWQDFSGTLFDPSLPDIRISFTGRIVPQRNSPPHGYADLHFGTLLTRITENFPYRDIGNTITRDQSSTIDVFMKDHFKYEIRHAYAFLKRLRVTETVAGDRLTMSGVASGMSTTHPNRRRTTLVFEDADLSELQEQFKPILQAKKEHIKPFIQPGKHYVANVSMHSVGSMRVDIGRLVMQITEIDEQRQYFRGFLFDVNNPSLRREIVGISNNLHGSYPYSIRTCIRIHSDLPGGCSGMTFGFFGTLESDYINIVNYNVIYLDIDNEELILVFDGGRARFPFVEVPFEEF